MAGRKVRSAPLLLMPTYADREDGMPPATRRGYANLVRMPSVDSPLAEMNVATLRERLREATAILELIAADRRILEGVPEKDKKRLLKAVTRVNAPDGRTRRRQLKAHARLARIEKVRREDSVLHETGIRTLRRKPVFNTPNVFPPRDFEPADVHEDAAARGSIEPQHC